MAPRKIRPVKGDPTRETDLEQMVEAQARGEAPQGVATEADGTRQAGKLDRRRSKFAKLLESLG